MRTQQLILRKIAEQNLDPTVAYVSGKNGKLVQRSEPKGPKDEPATTGVNDLSVTEAPLFGAIAPQEDQDLVVEEKVEEKPKKKPSPFKKKTVTAE